MTYKGYLIDLDGTMYRGKEPIPDAAEFINYLNEQGIPYLFVTNNSSATRENIAQKLINMGIQTTPDHVVTSAMATANYVKHRDEEATVYVIGEDGLVQALRSQSITLTDENANFVVVGIDRKISYEKIATASLLIQQGAIFISTNKDPAIPTERGLLPGNGALTAAISTASGREPIYIGKPEAYILEEALRMLQLKPNEVLMIGDNYLTDIMAGVGANIDTLMVLTGFSTEKDIDPSLGSPTYIEKNLNTWMDKTMPLIK